MDLQLRDKCALVSGGSRGIGRSIALALAREGCRVAVVARDHEQLARMAPKLDSIDGIDGIGPGAGAPRHITISADMATSEGTDAAITQTLAAFGAIDICVANVGKSGARHARDMDDADFAWSLDINLWSSMRVSQRVVPHMRARGGGAIVMISSIWGREAGGAPGYNVAKAGVISLAKAMARDHAADNIRVNSVAPGSTLFPGGGWARRQEQDPEAMRAFVERELPFGRFGSPDEIADVVTFLCSPRARWVSGACIPVDGCQGRAF
jgi:3-oxoacyl-[acyl-carrier protein] reductase